MIRAILVCVLLMWANAGMGQDSTKHRPVMGLEILRMPISLLSKSRFNVAKATLSIEPSVLIPTNFKYCRLALRGGYIDYKEAQGPANIRTAGRGWFAKAGVERRPKTVGYGLLGTVSVWRSQGSFLFEGTYFDDYIGNLPEIRNISVGVEGYIAPHVKLNSRFSLNVLMRLNVTTAAGKAVRGYAEPYIPGVGLTGGRSVRLGAATNLFLMYQL